MKASMGSILIVEAQPVWQSSAPLFGRRIGHGIGPFALQRLDEAFRFAVGLRSIRSGPFGSDTEPTAGFTERPRAIGAAVISQYPLNVDASTLEFAHGAQPEAGGGIALLIGQDFDVAKART